jgi:hypothetical protein
MRHTYDLLGMAAPFTLENIRGCEQSFETAYQRVFRHFRSGYDLMKIEDHPLINADYVIANWAASQFREQTQDETGHSWWENSGGIELLKNKVIKHGFSKNLVGLYRQHGWDAYAFESALNGWHQRIEELKFISK